MSKSPRSNAKAVSPPASKHPPTPSNWFGNLYPDQRAVAEFIIKRLRHGGGVGLFSKQGTGKTFITMAVLEQLRFDRVLVIAPLTALDITWHNRLATLGRVPVRSPQDATGAGAMTVLIHPEALTKHAPRLARMAWDIVVWDESQHIKARTSARSRAARRFRDAPRRLALSGTPIDTSQIDVWAQMRFIDHTVFGDRWGDFADAYCHRTGYMGKEWRFRPSRHTAFMVALRDHVVRLSIDTMKLPPLTIVPIAVDMYGDQRRMYDHMAEHSVATIGGVTITAPLTVTRDVKLAQITGGFIIDNDGTVHRVGYAKERKFRSLVHAITGTTFDGVRQPTRNLPIVVFCHYIHEVETIVTELTFRTPLRVATLR